jgi:thiamine-monophosphate kinase
MPEFDLIDLLARRAGTARSDVALGIGDDAALLDFARAEQLVACVDTLIAGVHFPPGTAPEDLGWKSLAVNLSDLAAMGAEPRFALLALTLPDDDRAFVHGLARGFDRLARRHGVALVGGDTTRGPLSISVTALGAAPRNAALRRAGAQVGDEIWVSGTLGDAAAGLAVVEGRLDEVAPRDAIALRRRLDRPTPRVALGLALRGIASAAIDVSDGLLADLGHVLASGGVGAQITRERVPVSPSLRRAVANVERRARFALAGGDDYELVFTAPAARSALVLEAASTSGVRVTRIGAITRSQRIAVLDAEGRAWDPGCHGYVHFDDHEDSQGRAGRPHTRSRNS